MSAKVHTGGGFVIEKPKALPPLKEIGYDGDEYSDGGSPCSPRPKAIFSLARHGSQFNLLEASRLQTVPVRLHSNSRARTPTPRDTPTGVSIGRRQDQPRLQPLRPSASASGGQSCSVGGIPKATSVDVSKVPRASRLGGPRGGCCTALRPAPGAKNCTPALPSSNASPSLQRAASRLKAPRPGPPAPSAQAVSRRVNSVGVPTAAKPATKAPPTTPDGALAAVSKPRRPFPSRLHPCEQASEEEEVTRKAAHMSLHKEKIAKKPARALSFSFGTDRKRRPLSFLGPFRRHQSNDNPEARLVAPNSPILRGRNTGRSVTLPSSLRTSTIQEQLIPEQFIAEHEEERGGEAQGAMASRAWKRFSRSSPRSSSANADPRADTRVHTSSPGVSRLMRSPGVLTRPSSAAGMYVSTAIVPPSPDGSPILGESSTSCLSSVGDSTGSFCGSNESLPRSSEGRQSDSTSASPGNSPTIRAPPPSSPRLRLASKKRRSSLVTRRETVEEGQTYLLSTCERGKGNSSGAAEGRERLEGNRSVKRGHSFSDSRTRGVAASNPDWGEMRHHIVRFLVETEQSYVHSLRTILKVYLEPLKQRQAVVERIAEPGFVDNVFYQIPEIYALHHRFLQQISARVEQWHSLEQIGDIFVDNFSKCQLMDVYSKFINNFRRAKVAIEIAKQSRPMFVKFLEQRARDSQGRLSLDDLLIKPVQRIPRYLLFLRDLLKHTAPSHPDHAPLHNALGELATLAERVNESERDSSRLEQQRELIGAVDGLAQLLTPESSLVRCDMVTEIKGNVHRRDRFLILFSDMVVCASTRRKSSGFRRNSLLNLSSQLHDSLRYKIKWQSSLSQLSIAQVQAVMSDRRRQNTLEKMLETNAKDSAALQQMLEQSSFLHRPHEPLVVLLKDMLAEAKDEAASMTRELESLPQDAVRIDLVCYASVSPTLYSVVFPSHNIQDSWKTDFLMAKKSADLRAPSPSLVAPPTSPLPSLDKTNGVCDFQFLHPLLLQSGRIGTQLTNAAVGLPIDSSSSRCLWVCCSDAVGGQVCLLDLERSVHPQLVANITVSASKILSLTAVPRIIDSDKDRPESPAHSQPTDSTHFRPASPVLFPPPTSCSVVISSLSSSDSSGCLSHNSLSRTGSSSSEEGHVAVETSILDHADSALSWDGQVCNGHQLEEAAKARTSHQSEENATVENETERSHESSPCQPDLYNGHRISKGKTTVVPFVRVRSNSVPAVERRVGGEGAGLLHRYPSPSPTPHRRTSGPPSRGRSLLAPERPSPAPQKAWSPLTLRPVEDPRGEVESMWLGTAGGQVHVYRAGDNLRSRSNRHTVDLGNPVQCIRYHRGYVYAGLGNGTVAVFRPEEDVSPTPLHTLSLGSTPVSSLVPVGGELWAASGGSLYLLGSWDPESGYGEAEPVLSLPSNQTIQCVVATGNTVWVSGKNSPLLYLFHAHSRSRSATVDCTPAIMEALKAYNSIIQHHKIASLSLTHLLSSPSHLLIGTSVGVILTLPLPPSPLTPSLPLPRPSHLPKGHADFVHFLSLMEVAESTLVLSGGCGFEDFSTGRTSEGIPDTASCLLVWRSPL